MVFTEWLAALAAEKQGEVKLDDICLYCGEDATLDLFLSFLQITDLKPYLGEGDAEEQEKINDSAEQTWGVKHAGGGSAACYGRGEVNIFGKLKRNVSFLYTFLCTNSSL